MRRKGVLLKKELNKDLGNALKGEPIEYDESVASSVAQGKPVQINPPNRNKLKKLNEFCRPAYKINEETIVSKPRQSLSR